MKAQEVIKIGRRRSFAPLQSGVSQRLALFVFVLCELDDQNRVLGGKPDQHHQADLRVDIVFDLDHVSRLENREQNAPQP
jgi:hypothetical protein